MRSVVERFVAWMTEPDAPEAPHAPVDPEAWHAVLRKELPFYRALSTEDRQRLWELMDGFLDAVPIEGVSGFEVTDDVRVVLAATACRLILHLDLSAYRALTTVYVYPHDVLVHPETQQKVLGVAYGHGAVVLSWPAVVRGLENPVDERDTALHEFAHALDFADGHANGAPLLRCATHYASWARVLANHYDAMQDGRDIVRAYGATNPAEFFAVATEAFFERPDRLKARAPDLYAELVKYYGWEPPTVRRRR